MTRSVNYPATLCISPILAVTLDAVTFTVGARGARLHTDTTIKRLRILRSWTFDHELIPQLLLTARLGLGIQHVVHYTAGSNWATSSMVRGSNPDRDKFSSKNVQTFSGTHFVYRRSPMDWLYVDPSTPRVKCPVHSVKVGDFTV